jgi:hypothetical protein
MGMGEGGFAVSSDKDWIERVRCLSNFGIDPADFKVREAGTNAKLSEYHAAVGLAALARSQTNTGSAWRRYAAASGFSNGRRRVPMPRCAYCFRLPPIPGWWPPASPLKASRGAAGITRP